MLVFLSYFLASAEFEDTSILVGHEELFFLLAFQVDENHHYMGSPHHVRSDLNHQRCLGTSNGVSEMGEDPSY